MVPVRGDPPRRDTLIALLTALLVALSAFVHHEVLRLCNEYLPNLERVPSRAKVLLSIAAAFCSHLAQIALFAGVYWLLHDTALGSLRGHFDATAASFFYFSAETYTTLGFGDVYPLGQMRLLAGIEAITGLLMVSWSASFTYRSWREPWSGFVRNEPRAR